MFDRIVTLSLNPAIDVTLWVDQVLPGSDNFVRAEKYAAGGKAVNISRVLSMYGVDNVAVVLAGRHNLTRYESRLKEEGIRYALVPVEGSTRENIVVVQQDRSTTRFLREGFTVPYEAVEELLQQLSRLVSKGTLVVISGTLPGGISVKVLKTICRQVTPVSYTHLDVYKRQGPFRSPGARQLLHADGGPEKDDGSQGNYELRCSDSQV